MAIANSAIAFFVDSMDTKKAIAFPQEVVIAFIIFLENSVATL